MRTGISLTVTPAIRRHLKAVAANRNSPQKHVWRAQIVLLFAAGVGTNEIMRQTGKSKTCVWRWQERFMAEGFDGLLHDKTRPSRVAPLGADVAERVVALTQSDPPAETTHWTAPMMAKEIGISASSVQRIWHAHGLQPHRFRRFKLRRWRRCGDDCGVRWQTGYGYGLVFAFRMAEADAYVGYMEPYATSHEALDEDRAFQQEVVNAAQALGVRLARLGRLDNPDAGLVSRSRNRIQCEPAPPEQGLVLRGEPQRGPGSREMSARRVIWTSSCAPVPIFRASATGAKRGSPSLALDAALVHTS